MMRSFSKTGKARYDKELKCPSKQDKCGNHTILNVYVVNPNNETAIFSEIRRNSKS